MPPEYKKPGDRFIKAADWNLIVDATRQAMGTNPSWLAENPLAGMKETVSTLAENLSGIQLTPGDCVVIVGYSLAEIERGPVLQVAVKNALYDTGFMAVVLDYINPGLHGPVAIYGLAWAQYLPGTGAFGTLADGDTYLHPSDSGPAQILHARADGLALIRFPVGGGGGGGSGTAELPFHVHDFYICGA